MFLQRRGHRRLDLAARHRRAFEPLDQHGGGVDEARRAVPALEAELVEEGLLHRREREEIALVVPAGDALDGADAFAVEEAGAGDAGLHLLAGLIVAIPNHHAGMTDADAAAQPRAGEAEHRAARRSSSGLRARRWDRSAGR